MQEIHTSDIFYNTSFMNIIFFSLDFVLLLRVCVESECKAQKKMKTF